MIRRCLGWLAASAWLLATPLLAQRAIPPTAPLPDPATIEMPRLDFAPTAQDAADYEKYFYFHREGASFAEARGDVKECDALASGISVYSNNAAVASAAYGGVLAAGIGAAIGSIIDDAISGSALRRKIRRINMRNCMGFKGYQRYGLRKELWEVFNFEEGNGRKRNDVREAALLRQARVASGPKPQQQALAP